MVVRLTKDRPEFSRGFLRALDRHATDPEDRRHLETFACNLIRVRLDAGNHRGNHVCHADRVHREVCRRMTGLVNALARGGPVSFRTQLPMAPSAEHLRDLALRCSSTKQGFVEWIHFFQGAINRGLFASSLPLGTRIPRGGCLLRARQRRALRRPITVQDVERLEAVARTERDRLVLALLRHTGLRREALASLRVEDVWDSERACVHPSGIRAIEKYGESRWIAAPHADLVAAIERYLHSLESPLLRGATGFLIHGESRPCPSTVTSTLQRLCRRAGIDPPFRPHQFRTFVVDEIIARGGTLRDAADFIGHRSMLVTYQYYFSGGVSRERIPTVCAPPPEDKEKWALLRRLRAARCRMEGSLEQGI